jgi:predicted nucleic acid-binding protein
MALLTSILDSCVLFPASLRDTLLRAAALELYQPRWSTETLDEVRRNLVEKGRTEEQTQRLTSAITQAFPEGEVTQYHDLIDQVHNHPKDRHVLAAAVATGAQVIVTSNLRDFPQEALAPFNVEAQSPDVFLTRLFELSPGLMTQVVVDQAGALRNPPKTASEVLDMLAKHAPNFAACVRERLER